MATNFLTLDEAAAKLKVSPRTVRRWIKQGDLAAIKIGQTVRILEKGLDQLANTHPYAPGSALDIAAASDEAFAETWDNDSDAAYDNWRDIYGVSKG